MMNGPLHRIRIYLGKPIESTDVNSAIDSFARKAFRRAISYDDTQAIKNMMKKMLANRFSKEETLKAGLVAVLSFTRSSFICQRTKVY